jgi:hypothetical protein
MSYFDGMPVQTGIFYWSCFALHSFIKPNYAVGGEE